MLNIASSRLRVLLREFRKALGIKKSVSFQLITFTTTDCCLTVRAATDEVMISYQFAGKFRPVSFNLTVHDLSSVVRRCRRDVRFETANGQIIVTWHESGRQLSRTLIAAVAPFYEKCPQVLYSNPPALAQALLCAAQTTDGESSRYSIGCIRLRSSDGQIAATDGRQAIVQSGFSLPEGELLVPARALKSFAALKRCDSISIGRSDDWVSFSVGERDARWCLAIKQMLLGRFPDIDGCLPSSERARSTLTISEGDAQFLIGHLSQLSQKREEQGPITLDLGEELTVRAKVRISVSLLGRQHAPGTSEIERQPISAHERVDRHGVRYSYRISEFALATSEYVGMPVRCATDHRFVLGSLRQGFREISFQDAERPAFCREANRAVTWALCNASFILEHRHRDEQLSSAPRVENAA